MLINGERDSSRQNQGVIHSIDNADFVHNANMWVTKLFVYGHKIRVNSAVNLSSFDMYLCNQMVQILGKMCIVQYSAVTCSFRSLITPASILGCLFNSLSRLNEITIRVLHYWHFHDDVIKWEHFLRYCHFVRGIHQSPVNSPHKGPHKVIRDAVVLISAGKPVTASLSPGQSWE